MQPVSQDRLVGSGPSESASLAEPHRRPEAPAIQYDAFISYSHAADDRLAPALRSGLQRFATPWRLFRLTNPVRSLRIFQDTASLSANPELWPTIERALMASDWFVLLASPDAAASPWVGKEVTVWCRHKSSAHLLIVQTAGEISWDGALNDFDWTKTDAVPQVLSGAFREEPRWVDARFARTEKQVTLRDPRFRDLVAEIAAPLRGIPKDDLIGEDIRQHRRLNFRRNAGVAFLTALLIVAASAAVIAIRNGNEAEQNFNHAVNTADTLVSEVAQRLQKLAGIRGVSADTIREILIKAEGNYEELMAVRPDSSDLQDKQAIMLVAFADTYAALGDTNEQMKRAQKALGIMKNLVARDSANITWKGHSAVSHCAVGDAWNVQNELTDAVANYDAGKMLLEGLAAQDPHNTEWKRDLMRCYGPMADVLYRQGDQGGALAIWSAAKSFIDSLYSQELHDAQRTGEVKAGVAKATYATDLLQSLNMDIDRSLSALVAYQQAVKELLNKDPDNPQRLDELAGIYSSIGDDHLSRLASNDALQAYQAAIDILERLANQDPKNTRWQSALIWNYNGKGNAYDEQNDLKQALEAYNAAGARLQSLAAHDSNNADWQHELAYNRWRVGVALATQGDFNWALAAYRTAQQRLESILGPHPNNINWQQDLIAFQDMIANALVALNDTQGALTELENNKTKLAELLNRYADNPHLEAQVAENLHHIGTIKDKQGDHATALEALRGARAVWERLININSDNLDFHYMDLVRNDNAIGDVLFAQGDLESALSEYRSVQAMIEHLTSESARGQLKLSRVDHLLQAELVRSHYVVAKVFQAKRDFAGMLEAYQAGQNIAEPRAHGSSENNMWQQLLSVGHSGRGQSLLSQGNSTDALKAFREVKTIDENMMAQYPNDPTPQLALAFIQKTIGGLLSLQGDEDGAVKAFRQSAALLRQHSGKIPKGQLKLADALGGLSAHCLIANEFAEAKAAAEESYSLDQQQIGSLINLAHAEMLLGHTDDAIALHVQHLNDVIPDNGNKRWGDVVVSDFAEFKKRGLKSPNMINIEQLLTKEDH